jgi:RNA polymerase sigma-70 factor (ECF subfamily)
MDGETKAARRRDVRQGSPDRSRETEDGYIAGRPEAVAQVDRWIREELASGFPVLRHEADDLCQSVHGKLIRALRAGAFRHESSLRTFVARVTRYSAVDQIRRSHRDPLWGQDAEARKTAWRGTPYHALVSLEKGALLGQILLHSARECRRLWHLAFVEQLSYDQIASALGIQPGTVKSRMSRCRQRVMELLGRVDG